MFPICFLFVVIFKCRSMISFYIHPLYMHSTCQPGIAQQIDCRTRQKSNCMMIMMRFEEMMSKDMTPDNIAYNTLYARHVHILEHHVIILVWCVPCLFSLVKNKLLFAHIILCQDWKHHEQISTFWNDVLRGGFKHFLCSPRTLGKWSNLTT